MGRVVADSTLRLRRTQVSEKKHETNQRINCQHFCPQDPRSLVWFRGVTHHTSTLNLSPVGPKEETRMINPGLRVESWGLRDGGRVNKVSIRGEGSQIGSRETDRPT